MCEECQLATVNQRLVPPEEAMRAEKSLDETFDYHQQAPSIRLLGTEVVVGVGSCVLVDDRKCEKAAHATVIRRLSDPSNLEQQRRLSSAHRRIRVIGQAGPRLTDGDGTSFRIGSCEKPVSA